MSAVFQPSGALSNSPVMPHDLSVLDTGHGLVTFHAVEHRVHGVKVSIKTEVQGSGGGWWFAGTGMSGMSMSSESQAIREFWLAPADNGKDTRLEMVDGDFHVADGQTVIGLYAQVESTPRELFAMINVNSGCAMQMGDSASSAFHNQCAAALVGKDRNLNGIVIFAATGLALWAWFVNGWKVGLPALIAAIVGVTWALQKIPLLKSGSDHFAKKALVSKKIKERVYLCSKWIDSHIGPKWV